MLIKTNPIENLHSKEEIRAHIEKMVRDSAFFSSNILKRFLLFIVNETLEGRSNCLKEYTIATNVLNKPYGFKPQENGIVRIHAGRLRRAISQYYIRNGCTDKIRISIPKGNYVPVFENAPDQTQNRVSEEIRTVNMTGITASRKVKVSVLPFRYNADQKIAKVLADGIGFQLTAGLQTVNNFSVVAFQMIQNLSEHVTDLKDLTTKIGAEYYLTGGIETIKDRIRISIELVKAGSFEQVWSDLFDKRISESNVFDLEDEIIKSALSNLRIRFNGEPAGLHKVTMMPAARTNVPLGKIN
jgi:TolB-like protein